MTACSLFVSIACRTKSLLAVYTYVWLPLCEFSQQSPGYLYLVVSHYLCRYDLRSVGESKTILHRLYGVVADYIVGVYLFGAFGPAPTV